MIDGLASWVLLRRFKDTNNRFWFKIIQVEFIKTNKIIIAYLLGLVWAGSQRVKEMSVFSCGSLNLRKANGNVIGVCVRANEREWQLCRYLWGEW